MINKEEKDFDSIEVDLNNTDYESLKLILNEGDKVFQNTLTIHMSLIKKAHMIFNVSMALFGIYVLIYGTFYDWGFINSDNVTSLIIGTAGVICVFIILIYMLFKCYELLDSIENNLSLGSSIEPLFETSKNLKKEVVISSLIIGRMLDIKIAKWINISIGCEISIILTSATVSIFLFLTSLFLFISVTFENFIPGIILWAGILLFSLFIIRFSYKSKGVLVNKSKSELIAINSKYNLLDENQMREILEGFYIEWTRKENIKSRKRIVLRTR